MFDELSALIEEMLRALSLEEEGLMQALLTLSLLWLKRRIIPERGPKLRAKLYHLIGDSLKLFDAIKDLLPDVEQLVDVGTGIGVPGIPLAIAVERLYTERVPQLVLVDRSSRGLRVCAGTLRALREEGFLRTVRILVLKADLREIPQLLGSNRRLWLARAVVRPPRIFQLLGEVALTGDIFAWQYSAKWHHWLKDIRLRGWQVVNSHEYRLPLGEPRNVLTLVKLGGEADENIAEP